MLKPHIGEETLEFFKTIPKSLYPHSYLDLRNRTLRQAIKYFFSILVIAYLVMLAISAPKLVYLSNYLETQFTKFEKFNIQLDIKTSSPVVITDKDPLLVIAVGNFSNLTYNKVLITDNMLYFKESFNKVKEINYRDYLDILGKEDTIRKVLVISFYLMIPTIIFLLYIISLTKYLVIILIASVLTYFITRLIKYEVSIRETITTAIYASTIMLLLEIIALPLQINRYLLVIPVYSGISISLIPLAAFLTVYLIAIILISGKFVIMGK